MKEMGLVASRSVAHSPPQTVYAPLVTREEVPAFLVDRLITNLNKAMPEAVARAIKKLAL